MGQTLLVGMILLVHSRRRLLKAPLVHMLQKIDFDLFSGGSTGMDTMHFVRLSGTLEMSKEWAVLTLRGANVFFLPQMQSHLSQGTQLNFIAIKPLNSISPFGMKTNMHSLVSQSGLS